MKQTRCSEWCLGIERDVFCLINQYPYWKTNFNFSWIIIFRHVIDTLQILIHSMRLIKDNEHEMRANIIYLFSLTKSSLLKFHLLWWQCMYEILPCKKHILCTHNYRGFRNISFTHLLQHVPCKYINNKLHFINLLINMKLLQTVTWWLTSFCPSVTLREELIGRMRVSSRLPPAMYEKQYWLIFNIQYVLYYALHPRLHLLFLSQYWLQLLNLSW